MKIPVRAPEVSLIIPCLNEARNAAFYEETLFKPLDGAPFTSEVIFSDGGSTDGTGEIIKKAAAGRPEVRLLEAGRPSSFAESIIRAIAVCRGEYAVFLEADLSFSPADIPRLLAEAKAGSCDCVCGSPFLGTFKGIGLARRALTGSANLLLRLRFGASVTAYTQIFKLFRTEALRSLEFESKGFMFDAELVAKSLARGFKITEVPVTMTARTMDSSKLDAPAEIFGCLRLIVSGVR